MAAAGENITCCAAHVAESLALRLGLELSQTVGCNRVYLNADNWEVIQTMKDRAASSTLAAVLLPCQWPTLKAKGGDPQVWLDDPPPYIVSLLVSDVIPLTS